EKDVAFEKNACSCNKSERS
ncbi:hypothetical protein CCACVL1_00225, partial [Corchorus capsularis]